MELQRQDVTDPHFVLGQDEARHHPRVRGSTGVELRAQEGRFAGRAHDLSLTGCYVETRGALRSAALEVVLQVPGPWAPIVCPAEVVRTDPRPDGSVGVALRFLDLDWPALLGLARLVAPKLA